MADRKQESGLSSRNILVISGIIVWPVWLGLLSGVAIFAEEVLGWNEAYRGPEWITSAAAIIIFGIGFFLWRILAFFIESRWGQVIMSEPSNELKGLGGWLVFVGIGAVIAPFRLLVTVFLINLPIFGEGSWEVFTSPEGELYHAFWAPLLIGALVINLGLVIVSSYMLYLYFAKKKLFPQLFVAISFFSLVFVFLDAWATTIVLPDEPMFDPETAREAGLKLANVLAWVPYMWVSRRVKATFVE